MSAWDWFLDYEYDAWQQNDRERQQLAGYHHRAYELRETNPDRALDLIAQGAALARERQESWWQLFYDHYRVHALLHFKQDYRDVLDLAVRNTLEVRKPGFADFPRRLLIHHDLISAYSGIDPEGYAQPIREALDWLDAETPPTGEDRYMLLGGKREFALELNDLATAEEMVQESLRVADMETERTLAQHFSVFTYSAQADLAWRRKDFVTLAEAARCGEELARLVGHKVELAEFLMWQGFLARKAGDEQQASRLQRQASQQLARVQMPPLASYFNALCAYHELAGQLDQAIQARQQELETLRDRGRHVREARCRLEICKLLAKQGTTLDGEEGAARTAFHQLRHPEPYLEELESIKRRDEG